MFTEEQLNSLKEKDEGLFKAASSLVAEVNNLKTGNQVLIKEKSDYEGKVKVLSGEIEELQKSVKDGGGFKELTETYKAKLSELSEKYSTLESQFKEVSSEREQLLPIKEQWEAQRSARYDAAKEALGDNWKDAYKSLDIEDVEDLVKTVTGKNLQSPPRRKGEEGVKVVRPGEPLPDGYDFHKYVEGRTLTKNGRK